MKPRILFVLHLPPPIHGASMVGSFIKESTQINEAFDADFINLSTSLNLSESSKGGIKKHYRLLKILLMVLSALIRKKHDLVYLTLTASGPGFYKDLLVVSLLRVFNKKTVYHFHNKGVATAKAKPLNNFLYKFTFKRTQSILLSEALFKDVESYVAENDVYFCPNGIPLIDKIHLNKKTSRPLSEPISLLFLSNMMKEKGVFTLLDACEILNDKGIKFKCDFVGAWSDVSEEDFHAAVVKRSLSKVVFAHGSKYGEEKVDFFCAADIFVFPTFYHYEAFSLVILEAMQYQMPVVSTMEGGIPDMVIDGETGFLINQHDFKDLASKLELLISNPETIVKMGLSGRARFLSLYTRDKFEENMIDVLNKAVNHK